MSHRYKLRQMVRLVRVGFADSRSGGASVYEIVRLMPADQTGEPAYRIKSETGERAVRESEISAVS
jgi:hypothetical protein